MARDSCQLLTSKTDELGFSRTGRVEHAAWERETNRSNGDFSVSGIPGLPWHVHFRKAGYRPATLVIDVARPELPDVVLVREP